MSVRTWIAAVAPLALAPLLGSCSDDVQSSPPPGCDGADCGCNVVSDCPGADDPCSVASCIEGSCSLEPYESGRSCSDDAGVCDGGGRCVLTSLDWQSLPTAGAPSARRLHSAVWTGEEMIVWGGRVEGMPNVTATGARYNPATVSWSPVSDVGAPSARHSHAALMIDGDRMVVWGGFGQAGYLNDGAIYSPASDSWTALPTEPAISGRTRHSMVLAGSDLIIFGGLNDVSPQPGGWRFDLGSQSWSALSSAGVPSQRMAHAAVWTGDDMIVWGGTDTFDWLNTGAHYAPDSDSWTQDTPQEGVIGFRESAAHVWTGSAMLIWGGWNGGPYLNDGGSYQPDAGWSAMSDADAPSPRQRPGTVWTGEELVVWGGCGGDLCGEVRADGGRYTPLGPENASSDRWFPIELSAALQARSEHSMVWTGSEIIVWGGADDSGTPLADGARAGL